MQLVHEAAPARECLPAGQLLHAAAEAGFTPYLPESQKEQLAAPSHAYLPEAHAAQLAELDVAANMPKAHEAQLTDLAGAYVPEEHPLHTLLRVAPVAADDVPAGQLAHEAEALASP